MKRVIRYVVFIFVFLNFVKAELVVENNHKAISSEKYYWVQDAGNARKCDPLFFQNEDGSHDIYRSGEKCFYEHKNLIESYKAFRKNNINNDNGKYLLKTLVIFEDYEEEYEEDDLIVTYQWVNDRELKVELLFAGGITTLFFKEENQGTDVSVIYDAD